MKRRVTILSAALTLLAFLAIPMGMMGQTKTEGFEAATASTNYQSTVTVNANQSDCGIGWSIYYGAVSTTGPIAGTKSAQMRWYKSAPTNYPYLKSTTAIDNLTNVAFKARVGNTDVKMDVSYSTDGTTWTSLATAVTFSNTNATDFSYSIPSGGKYIKIGVSSSSTASMGSYYALLIDNVVFTYSSNVNTYTVTYHANVAGVSDIEVEYNEGATVTIADNTFSNPGYVFTEWNTEADGSGDSYAPGDEIEDIDDNFEFYAQWEESSEITATITKAKLELSGTSYSSGEKTIDGITYTYANLMPSGNNIQVQANNGTIKNSTPYPGDIISVVITHSGTARATTINGSMDGTNWTQVATGSGSITADFSGMGYKYFQITRGSNAAYWEKVDIIYSAHASTQSESDLAITNASTDFTFDLYNNSTAQVINYTTSSTGAITITPASPTSYFSYVHDATAKTITVTPLAVTPSAQTVTISQEADENYYPGTTTFTVSVTNSDPNMPGSFNNPYTVAQARAAIDANSGVTGVYATGIVSENNYFSSNNGYITYFISADGSTESDQLEAFHGMNFNGAVFTSADEIQVGDSVVIYGNLMKYHNNNTNTDVYEFESGNQLVFLKRPTPVLESYDLTVSALNEHINAIYVFDATDENNPLIADGLAGTVQVIEGTDIIVSPDVEDGYVLQSLTVLDDEGESVQPENHMSDGGYYSFTMPSGNVTITAIAVEEEVPPTPADGDYVRITSLDQLTDGSIVIIAARYEENTANGYYAMPNTLTSGKANGVNFTSMSSDGNEILPASIVNDEEDYYWTVNVTENGYTFTNADGDMIGYGTSGTNFVMNSTKTEWTITLETADETAMVAEYIGFVIKNKTTNTRAFAFNGSVFGAYATTNMNASGYNFFLDFFVQTEEVEQESYTLDITGYTNDNTKEGYYLIASPVTVDPATAGMTTGDYDLYYFDQSEVEEWRNYEANPFNLIPGKGYLYAMKATAENPTYSFELTGMPYSDNGEIALDYDDNAEFPGFNLIGNPFATNADLDKPYYRLSSDGTLNTTTESSAVNLMEGVFVQATAANQTATFTPSNSGSKRISQLSIKVTRNRGAVLDNAIIRFDNGAMLGKFQLNPNDTKIYITEGNQDYAIVRSANAGEMPVNFKAAENGNYTLSIETENVEVSYLHLIDNMTGANVDLLATPSYSFDARTTDNANRFRLMFNTNGVDENTTTASFAYFNGSSWTISDMGEATLQVVDMMGRVISTQAISGNTDVNLNQAAGVYMLRLVNGENVMVQKVVVK